MYSREDRDAIIALCRESGLPLARFARESGLASRESMRLWMLGDEPRGWHPPYAMAERAGAARRVLAGEDPAEVAASLGCRPATVRGWARAERMEGAMALAQRADLDAAPVPRADPDDLEALREENAAPRLELARARAVLDVLKGGVCFVK